MSSFGIQKDLETYITLRSYLQERGIRIVTIASNADICSKVNIYHFARYVPLSMEGVRTVDYDNRGANRIVRALIIKKKKSIPRRAFFNQTTIQMKPRPNPNNDEINIKVFKNRSLQITGCKDMEDFYDVVTRLIEILKNGVTATFQDGTEHKIAFCKNPDELEIKDVMIRLIVSCFNLDYKIDRRHLARLLKHNHSLYSKDQEIGYIKFKNDPNGKHSCVNIKYRYDDDTTISIFVFHTGSVIITAAKTLPQIISAYEYAMKILVRYREQVRVIDFDPTIMASIIKNYRKIHG